MLLIRRAQKDGSFGRLEQDHNLQIQFALLAESVYAIDAVFVYVLLTFSVCIIWPMGPLFCLMNAIVPSSTCDCAAQRITNVSPHS